MDETKEKIEELIKDKKLDYREIEELLDNVIKRLVSYKDTGLI
ncbi:hypothetical protein [Clostridium brassicae]|uniref:Uncharacterized protein n=1 Tax=Clostridium brassicae TaxID=2999072 RepID=A0ABT4D6Q5_9CLOT|nr:hypothetical protein [Clostridium brassicae]MCY6957984.1 hypothetical protein [Clostridium brassicae]